MANFPDYSLRQVIDVIPCSERTLRRRIKAVHDGQADASSIPPYTWHEPSQSYRFPYEGLKAWLEKREALRKATGKGFLRWLDESETPFSKAVEVADEDAVARKIADAEAKIALQLRKELVEKYGDKLSGAEITELVLSAIGSARKAREAGAA